MAAIATLRALDISVLVSNQDDIRNAGAEWTDEECVRDENWVSSRQPTDIPTFNKEMIRLFAESKAGNRPAA